MHGARRRIGGGQDWDLMLLADLRVIEQAGRDDQCNHRCVLRFHFFSEFTAEPELWTASDEDLAAPEACHVAC